MLYIYIMYNNNENEYKIWGNGRYDGFQPTNMISLAIQQPPSGIYPQVTLATENPPFIVDLHL